jgi:predicted ATPase/class 3 adenylate cyclase
MVQTEAGVTTVGAATVTLLFSDIEGSTRLLQSLGSRYAGVLQIHHGIVRACVEKRNGRVIDNAGDGFFIVFARASDALVAAVEIQRRLAAAAWPEGTEVRVRMGVHTGEPSFGDSGYIGLDVHRAARICSAAAGGQILLSSSTHHLVESELPAGILLRDLGQHRLKDLHEPEHITQIDIDDLPREFPPIGGMRARLHNAGDPATLLIGRDREVTEICELLLRDEVRAVTLTGPGGTGKTRLALAVAIRAADAFENGAWFVPLASIREPALVGPTIARALGVSEHTERSAIESIILNLADRHTLLLLDNFEQVEDAAPLVADLLAACPRLEVLVTSRGVLHIRSEYAYPVSPLSVPEPARWTDRRALEESPAVRLFIERARAVHPGFMLNADNASVVAEICARLDGLPLALELAAARTRLFSPESLLSRIGRRLDLLKGGARDLPERHQTLRQTIAWSHDLLTDEEQKLFRQLAVFIGGCTVEAAEDVIEKTGALDIDVIDGIGSLVDRALIRREDRGDGETRFVMLETIREFGLERLEASGEAERVRRAHAEHFVSFAERAAPGLSGPEMSIWLDRLESDHDNLRAVLAWAEHIAEPEPALRLGASLWKFWIIRGHMREGRERLIRVLAIPGARTPSQRLAATLHGLGTMTHEISDLGPARAWLEETLAVCEKLGDAKGSANATAGLGWIATIAGRLDEAEALSRKALEQYRELGDEAGVALGQHQVAWIVLSRGLPAEAAPLAEDVLRIRLKLGDRRAIAFSQTNLASTLTLTGDYGRARSLLEEAFITITMLRDRQVSAWNLSRQGVLAWETGDTSGAANVLGETLEMWREVGNAFGLAMSLTEIAPVLARLGQHERAAASLDEAEHVWERTGSAYGLITVAIGRAVCTLERGDLATAARELASCALRAAEKRNAVGGTQTFDLLAGIAATWDLPGEAAVFLAGADSCRALCGIVLPPRRIEEDRRIRQICADAPPQQTADAGNEAAHERAIELARRWEKDVPAPR